MKTYRISEEEIKSLKPLAVGYKIFNHDWTSKQGYDYKDENGNVLGTIHKVDGDIKECKWGLHFSKLPQDCFNFYESVQWNKFAKVEAYGEIVESDKKTVAKIIKIVQVFTFDEFIAEIQNCLQGKNFDGKGISNGEGISYGYGIYNGKGIYDGYGISYGYGIYNGKGIYDGYGIYNGKGISNGEGISYGYGIYNGKGISNGEGISYGYGISNCFGLRNCEGVSRSIFCFEKSGKLMIFNKKTTEKRFNEVFNKLNSYGWYPKFNNAEELKGNLEWYETNIPAIVKVEAKIAWSSMPKEMLEYIKSLPEFNAKIFNKITEMEM